MKLLKLLGKITFLLIIHTGTSHASSMLFNVIGDDTTGNTAAIISINHLDTNNTSNIFTKEDSTAILQWHSRYDTSVNSITHFDLTKLDGFTARYDADNSNRFFIGDTHDLSNNYLTSLEDSNAVLYNFSVLHSDSKPGGLVSVKDLNDSSLNFSLRGGSLGNNALSSGSFTPGSPVPTPAAFWLMGSALLGLFRLSSNRQKSTITT